MQGMIRISADILVRWKLSDPEIPTEILSVEINGFEFKLDGFSGLSGYIRLLTHDAAKRILEKSGEEGSKNMPH